MGDASKRMKTLMAATAFRDDLLDFVDRHKGRVRYMQRSSSGLPKLISVAFGPRTLPSFRIDVSDYARPEDPLARNDREAAQRAREHDRRYTEMQEEIDKALRRQRKDLRVEWGLDAGPQDQTPEATSTPSIHRQAPADERWSKRSFTDHLAATLGLGNRTIDSIGRVGSNVIMVDDEDQTFKITVSMPRKK
jgi:hypothetical protein